MPQLWLQSTHTVGRSVASRGRMPSWLMLASVACARRADPVGSRVMSRAVTGVTAVLAGEPQRRHVAARRGAPARPAGRCLPAMCLSPQPAIASRSRRRGRCPFSVRRYSKRAGAVLVAHAAQHAVLHQLRQPIGEPMARDAEARLERRRNAACRGTRRAGRAASSDRRSRTASARSCSRACRRRCQRTRLHSSKLEPDARAGDNILDWTMPEVLDCGHGRDEAPPDAAGGGPTLRQSRDTAWPSGGPPLAHGRDLPPLRVQGSDLPGERPGLEVPGKARSAEVLRQGRDDHRGQPHRPRQVAPRDLDDRQLQERRSAATSWRARSASRRRPRGSCSTASGSPCRTRTVESSAARARRSKSTRRGSAAQRAR